MAFANLHIHSYFSDGLTGPHELAKQIVNENGLAYFALTDHDNMSGIEPFMRSLNKLTSGKNSPGKKFIPGIELSLMDEPTGWTIHIVGLFPNVDGNNYKEELRRIDSVVGDFCRYRGENRAVKDVDARIKRAFEINLEKIADHYDSADSFIKILRSKAEEKSDIYFKENKKEEDIIQHPIPSTYQTIIDNWEELLPSSSKEKITLYILRPAQSKAAQLADIYKSEGMEAPEAVKLAETNQGILVNFKRPVLKEMGVLEGLSLLQDAQAITILSHPAIDHGKVGYDEYDEHILNPLIKNGLDGIEVFYPYDLSHRNQSIERYGSIAKKHRLLVSGGTDYHGDGRTGLADVRLDVDHALKIINYEQL